MMKTLLSTTVFTAMLFGAAPAFADCATDMKTTNELVIKATDSAKKTEAQKHMVLANEKMAAKNEAGCMTHIGDAAKALK